ncbi:tetratricopeptide repeat protein, partial [Alphaproteobacteria bacterium]|nr:tetratricopeptide repeat protein [Alphaproteobacteria bacterium]
PQQLLGLYNQGRLEEALQLGVSLSQQHPNDANIPNILGAVETARGNYAEAIALYNKAIKLKPGRADFYNNLGAVLKKSGNPNLALSHYLKAIDIKTDFVEVYNNLGAILLEFPDRNEDVIFYLKKALILRPDYDNARNNLAVAFCNLGCLEEAEAQLQIGSFEAPRSHLLRQLYLRDDIDRYTRQLEILLAQDATNAILGSVISRASLKYGSKFHNPFCSKPIDHVVVVDLNKVCNFGEVFIEPAKQVLTSTKTQYKKQELLESGKQTEGNVFSSLDDAWKQIEYYIRLEIEKYQNKFSDSKEGFITRWPSNYTLYGWLLNMQRGSRLKAHMHEKAWLSGSIYINVPTKINSDDGNLVVCIEDDEMLAKTEANVKKVIDLSTGTLCLFPASCLHYTIPFDSHEDRVVLAFDVIPVAINKSS